MVSALLAVHQERGCCMVFAVDPQYELLKDTGDDMPNTIIWFTAFIFRMRAKTSDFLKVLNRAKIEDESAKKKISHQWGNKS